MLFNIPIAKAIALVVALTSTVAANTPKGYKGPKTPSEFRKSCPYHHPPENHRPKYYIRPSKNETDDISEDFYKALKKANHGGTLVLPKGQTFVIGKKLDLTFLNNVEVNLEGEILVCQSVLKNWRQTNCPSLPTTLPTGKITTSITLSKSQLCSGNGEARISRSLAMVH
jgi:galacturan 1,4-alpha-galacturonidase